LARPGGNLTGLSPLKPVVTAKRVELLREVIPHISHVAVLRNPTNPGSLFALRETEATARRLGMRVQVFEVRTLDEMDTAFRAAVEARADAMMVISDNFFFTQQNHIIDLGQRHRLPEMFDTGDFVKSGGLISYGANLADLYQLAAAYVDKILKGASPANLPVEQATKFELFVNLKPAKQLALTIPQSVLLRADEVIQ
jgi:putative ABC transport system substrate-binding protein